MALYPQPRLTKTFIEHRHFWRKHDEPAGTWHQVPAVNTGEVALDAQVQEWVERTGAVIVHPGQTGMHTTFEDRDGVRFRVLSLGLTVLYQNEGVHEQQEPTPTAAAEPGFGRYAGGAHAAAEFIPAGHAAPALSSAEHGEPSEEG